MRWLPLLVVVFGLPQCIRPRSSFQSPASSLYAITAPCWLAGSGRTRARISREQSEFPGKYTYFLIVYLFKFRHPRTKQREEFHLFAGPLQQCLLWSFGSRGIDRQRSNASTVALQICTFSVRDFLFFFGPYKTERPLDDPWHSRIHDARGVVVFVVGHRPKLTLPDAHYSDK